MASGNGPNSDLSTWIRNWVHYDNLATNFTKQSTTSRKIRDEFETRIINHLHSNHLDNAIIQVSGAKIQLCQEKSFPSLTIGRLEEYLHMYYQKKGQMADETDQIMRFIKQQKATNFETNLKLKKISTVPVPPPPQMPPQLK